jgi:5-methylcytosine-specific restriction endonuclease McrBC regulatory subunit McrC
MTDVISIVGKDCSFLSNQEGNGAAMKHLLSEEFDIPILTLAGDRENENLNIIEYNYQSNGWHAGRLVGQAIFQVEGRSYRISIQPRFGNLQLFRMFEEIYNIRLINSLSELGQSGDQQSVIKKLIAVIWINLLSRANKHGIPKSLITKSHKGYQLRGKLDIRKSLVSSLSENVLVGIYKEKSAQPLTTTILHKAYKILMFEYGLSKMAIPRSAKNAIDQIKCAIAHDVSVDERDYQSVRYKSIYQSFKPVVDLSWDIIKRKRQENKESTTLGYNFMIDMAEVWEIYIRSLLKKRFVRQGWRVSSLKEMVYQGKKYQRQIIPDIVLIRENHALVFDAKYKRMNFDYFDYDRSDFYQIHTYIHYFNQDYHVIAGGLLYPLSREFDENMILKNKADSIFGKSQSNTKFVVDGIDLTCLDQDAILREEEKFLNRIEVLTKIHSYA